MENKMLEINCNKCENLIDKNAGCKLYGSNPENAVNACANDQFKNYKPGGGDLISRSALLEAYDRQHEGEPGKARKLIEDALAVDAVEVVRCKDCIYFWTMCKDVGALPDEYCCEGERVQDEAPAVDAVEVDAEDDCAACKIVYSHERGEGDTSADE